MGAPLGNPVLEFMQKLAQAAPTDRLKDGLGQLRQWITQLEGQVKRKESLSELERGTYLGELTQMRVVVDLLLEKRHAIELTFKASGFWEDLIQRIGNRILEIDKVSE